MPSYGLPDMLQGLFRKTSASCDHSLTTGVLVVSRPILSLAGASYCSPSNPDPQEPTAISTIYRNTSDAAQTCLPPLQVVANMIPGVGGVIKGVIGGILSTLQFVDRYIQNKDDLKTLALRLHFLRHHIDDAPISRTPFEESTRVYLLDALQKIKTKLERMKERNHGAPSLAQDISECVTTLNNHLFEYLTLSQMQLQSDISEIKTNMAEYHSRHVQFIERSAKAGAPVEMPKSVSRGYAILIDATGREHAMLLDQCQHLNQLSAMLSVILFQCRPDEAEVQRWYIERKLYDFVIYNKTNLGMIQLTSEGNMWSEMESGTKIVMRAIIEEITQPALTAAYRCLCGTTDTVKANFGELSTALQCGFNIACQNCERRFQVTHTREEQMAPAIMDDTANDTPAAETYHLLRNFFSRQVVREDHAITVPLRNIEVPLASSILELPLYQCYWEDCGKWITGDPKTVRTHLSRAHDVSFEREMDNLTCCKWAHCSRYFRRRLLVRHICAHLELKWLCSICRHHYTRKEAVRAHMCKQAVAIGQPGKMAYGARLNTDDTVTLTKILEPWD